jgi:hypothetical protein
VDNTIKTGERDKCECILRFYNRLMLEVPHVDTDRHSVVQIFTTIIMNTKAMNENETSLRTESHTLSSMDPGPSYSPDDIGSDRRKAMELKTRLENWFIKSRESFRLANNISHMAYAITGDWNSGEWRNAAFQAQAQIEIVLTQITMRADEIRMLETDHVLMWQDMTGYARQSQTVAAISNLMDEHEEFIRVAIVQLSMEISPSLGYDDSCTEMFIDPQYQDYHRKVTSDLIRHCEQGVYRSDIYLPQYRPTNTDHINTCTALAKLCTSGTLCRYIEMERIEIEQAFRTHLYNCSHMSKVNMIKCEDIIARGDTVSAETQASVVADSRAHCAAHERMLKM